MPTTEEILLAGAAEAEKFVADSRSMDQAWKAGKLDEWLARRLEAELKEFNANNNGDTGANPQA